jgi:UDP-2-acetamido-2-deoxy-ribo-hexuluronate aminotransferase
MEFVDLNRQQAVIRAELESRIEAVLEHGRYIMGPEVKELEKRLAEFVGVRHAIGCSSGTDGLLMALMAFDVGPGDAIFTTPFTFIATAEVIALLGATPVFVDIDPHTFNINPDSLGNAIQAVSAKDQLKPKGVIPVDLFGLPADYDKIMSLADVHGMFVLEDGAQSLGAVYKGRRAGGLGHTGATSFFPAKPLGCYGDGGALFTDDDHLAEKMRSIRVHGKGTHKYENLRIGINGRLDTLQAAILLAKINIFEEELERRQRVAKLYTERLQGLVEVPIIPDGSMSAWAQYSILTDRREELQTYLHDQEIPTAVYYPTPLHLQPAFSYLGYTKGDFPVAEEVSRRILSLPMHPYLQDSDVEKIVGVVGAFFESEIVGEHRVKA